MSKMHQEGIKKLNISQFVKDMQKALEELGTTYDFDLGGLNSIKGFFHGKLPQYQIEILNELAKADILTFTTETQQTEFIIKADHKADFSELKERFNRVLETLRPKYQDSIDIAYVAREEFDGLYIPYSIEDNLIKIFKEISSKSSRIFEALSTLGIIKYNHSKNEFTILKPQELKAAYEEISRKSHNIDQFVSDLDQCKIFNTNSHYSVQNQMIDSKLLFSLQDSDAQGPLNTLTRDQKNFLDKLQKAGIIKIKGNIIASYMEILLIDDYAHLTSEQLRSTLTQLNDPSFTGLIKLPYLKERLSNITEEIELRQNEIDQDLFDVLNNNKQTIKNSLFSEQLDQDAETLVARLNMISGKFSDGKLKLSSKTASLLQDTFKEDTSKSNLYNYGSFLMSYIGFGKQPTHNETSSIADINQKLITIYNKIDPDYKMAEENFRAQTNPVPSNNESNQQLDGSSSSSRRKSWVESTQISDNSSIER